MSDSRARPDSSGSWDRARRAYLMLLGDEDPADAYLADGALDLRLGHELLDPDAVVVGVGGVDGAESVLFSGPGDLVEVKEIVEAATGVGTWPTPAAGHGELIRVRLELSRPAAVLGLLIAMEDLIERRSPWGRWRTVVDTIASRIAELDSVSIETRVVEAGG